MKPQKLSLTSMRIFSLIGIGGLFLYAVFTQTIGQASISRLQREPLNLQVAMVQQSRGTSCGEAVIAMVYNYAYPQTPISEQEVIEPRNWLPSPSPLDAPFTSPANMVKIARYYSDDVSTGTALSSGQGLALLIRNLRNGEPVIIDVPSNFNDPESEAHFVVVTGLSVDQNRGNAIIVHYNDPLTRTEESAEWAGDEGLWNAWQKNGDPGGSGWWLVIAPAS